MVRGVSTGVPRRLYMAMSSGVLIGFKLSFVKSFSLKF